ncbi:S1C family serine protease [Cryptosporangium aurantiacum]|uniref:Serine protease, S1-C subfamily, contains C-terminal PDZ domain n=1 Tax=Cryptosporangium aurantiacum TaxID=134849 RepID=A0A1M7R357_9ACTN|nr:trypsin-like peptidase domain-containing protein [Cryptosporangium aurantiacum]SHN39234.1 serine protease, S1-C subfamily, contains C-terminal PDZ domain [Cryptosporangium aurantiacum]
MSGLGYPRGPEFRSPHLQAPPLGPFPPPGPWPPVGPVAPVAPVGRRRRWPLVVTGALTVVVLSAGAGGAAGYLTGHDGSPPPGATATSGIPSDLVAAASRALPGVVSVQVRTGSGGASGSGFVFDDRGHIVTNSHVVTAEGGGPVMVVGSDGRRLRAEVVGTDPSSDIAVLRVDPSSALRPLDLADLDRTRVGEPVLAVGSPLGLSGTVTAGIVSALDRQVRLGGAVRQTAVQTDASINPGNSGGPLVNAAGAVVGVNTAIATLEGGGSIGIGFAIPVDRVRQVATTLIAGG